VRFDDRTTNRKSHAHAGASFEMDFVVKKLSNKCCSEAIDVVVAAEAIYPNGLADVIAKRA
jgi:hypothetical protein